MLIEHMSIFIIYYSLLKEMNSFIQQGHIKLIKVSGESFTTKTKQTFLFKINSTFEHSIFY